MSKSLLFCGTTEISPAGDLLIHPKRGLKKPLAARMLQLNFPHCPACFFVSLADKSDGRRDWTNAWSVAGGRGFERNSAMVSAIAETIERMCLMSGGETDPRLFATDRSAFTICDAKSFWQLDADQLLKIGSIRNHNTNSPCGQLVDELFTTSRLIGSGREQLVPASAVLADEDVRLGWPPLVSSSTGTAVRDTFEAAVQHAVLERVERDAVAIWWYNRMVAPRLSPEAALATLPVDFAEWLTGRRRRTWHLLIETDLPVPAVVALSTAPDGTRTAIGASAALDPADAVRSATLEMIQGEISLANMRAAQRSGAPPQIPPFLAWSDATNAMAERYLAGEGVAELGDPVRYDGLLEAFEFAGIDVAIVDLTRPEFEVPVARAVSRTLRDWQPRFAPGRLYDVPVARGLLPRAKTKAEMNPVAFPI